MNESISPNWAATAKAAGVVGSILRGESAVISFKTDGSVEMMQDDNVNLGVLGNQSVRRATEIRWSEATQSWDIELIRYDDQGNVTGGVIPGDGKGFPAYSTARAAEVRWLSLARAEGCDPVDEKGLELLRMARSAVMTGG